MPGKTATGRGPQRSETQAPQAPAPLPRRLLWFAVLWSVSVSVVGLAALLIRCALAP